MLVQRFGIGGGIARIPPSLSTRLGIPICASVKEERKHPTPVRRRLGRIHSALGRAVLGVGIGDGSTESRSALEAFRTPSVIRPECRTYVVVVE